MSASTYQCPDCRTACTYENLKPWGQDKENAYCVTWHCPKCGQNHDDLSMLGPLVPGPSDCLNCGSPDLGGQITCPDCGITAANLDGYLGLSALELRKPAGNAKVAFANGHFRKGMALLNSGLRDDIHLAEAWEMKLDFMLRLGFEASARTMLERALSQGASPHLYRQLSSVCQQLEEWDVAAESARLFLEKADATMQEKAEELSNLGNIFVLLGDPEAAEAMHREAVRLAEKDAGVYLNLADFLQGEGRNAEALRVAEHALQLEPTSELRASLLELRALMRAEDGAPELALADINEAIGIGAGASRTFFVQGHVLAMLGNLPEARNAMAKVLYLEPDNEMAQAAIDQIDQLMED
jgi:tetratricopeptide (TPR) repeat protein